VLDDEGRRMMDAEFEHCYRWFLGYGGRVRRAQQPNHLLFMEGDLETDDFVYDLRPFWQFIVPYVER
jgi:hypothetical protein